MHEIKIQVKDKIARYTPTKSSGKGIVCYNSDYEVTFDFDSDWDLYDSKTARFRYFDENGESKLIDVLFTGNVCPIPVIQATLTLYVGVYAGDIRTSTDAEIPCFYSTLSKDGAPPDPTPDVYNQLLDKIETQLPGALSAKEKAEAASEKAEAAQGKAESSAKSAEKSAEKAETSANNAESFANAANRSQEAAQSAESNSKAYSESAKKDSQKALESAAQAQASSTESKTAAKEAQEARDITISAKDTVEELHSETEQFKESANLSAINAANAANAAAESAKKAEQSIGSDLQYINFTIEEDGELWMHKTDDFTELNFVIDYDTGELVVRYDV